MQNNAIDMNKMKLVHTLMLPVRWRDLDDLGHVNNSVYFTYFEQARIEWWRSNGVRIEGSETGPVIVTAECTFIKPIFCPANLNIDVYAGMPGKSSYMMYYEIFTVNDDGNDLVAKGSTKGVWVDYKKGKSCPLPETVLAMIQ